MFSTHVVINTLFMEHLVATFQAAFDLALLVLNYWLAHVACFGVVGQDYLVSFFYKTLSIFKITGEFVLFLINLKYFILELLLYKLLRLVQLTFLNLELIVVLFDFVFKFFNLLILNKLLLMLHCHLVMLLLLVVVRLHLLSIDSCWAWFTCIVVVSFWTLVLWASQSMMTMRLYHNLSCLNPLVLRIKCLLYLKGHVRIFSVLWVNLMHAHLLVAVLAVCIIVLSAKRSRRHVNVVTFLTLQELHVSWVLFQLVVLVSFKSLHFGSTCIIRWLWLWNVLHSFIILSELRHLNLFIAVIRLRWHPSK